METKYFDEAFKDPLDLEYKGLEGIWKTIAKDTLGEDPDQMAEKWIQFRCLFNEDPDIAPWREADNVERWESDEQLIRFLRAGLWNEDEAIHVLKSYLNCCTQYLSIVKHAIPKKLDSVWDRRLNAITQYRDAYGRRIFIYRPGAWDPDEIGVEELFASCFLLFEMMTYEMRTQVAGINIVADLTGFAWKHLRCFGIKEMQCMASFLSGSFPLWVRRINVVNEPTAFSFMYNMMKPFLNNRAKSCIVFHGTDYRNLHEEVPKSILPETMGGPGDLDNSECVNLLKKRNQFYQEIVDKSIKQNS